MPTKYVISDHHFDHRRIIEYENRPFKDVNEMNHFMVEQWNSIVKKNDIVFHLGDFCFGKNDVIRYWFDQLKGRKILIMGNHDRHINHHSKFWYNIGFEEVYRYPIIYKPGIILSHEPIDNANIRYSTNIHGHCHSKRTDIIVGSNSYINISCEEVDYKPVNLDLLISEGVKR
jgi:calcineurin-like phosphoesterase family protein